MARLCAGGKTLRDQIDDRFPKRDTTSDGAAASPAHSAGNANSDHEPDKRGVVHAIDVDEDFGAPGDPEKFVTQLLAYARAGKDGGRLKYVIYEGRIASGTFANKFWKWRPYAGANQHDFHIHISFTPRADRDPSKWRLPILEIPKAPAKKAAKKTAAAP